MSKLTIVAAMLGVICLSAQARAQAPLTGLWMWADSSGIHVYGSPTGAMEGAPFLRYSMAKSPTDQARSIAPLGIQRC